MNIVAHVDSDAWTEESWTRECDVAEVKTTYAAWHPALTRLYPYSERWYKWALYDRDPLEQWSRSRATLLGDSAHAMLHYLGTGAGMAIFMGLSGVLYGAYGSRAYAAMALAALIGGILALIADRLARDHVAG